MRAMLCSCAALVALFLAAGKGAPDGTAAFAATFRDPPQAAGLTVYWIWPGPAVTRAGLDRDLENMAKAHISGATVLPIYPLSVDANQPFLSPEFLDLLA